MQAVLLLIVRRTATVNLVSTLFDAPRREPLIPLLFVSADDVAVTITQDCRQAVAFVTCRQQDWALPLERVIVNPARIPHGLKSGLHLIRQISIKIGQTFRILTFRGNRDPACEVVRVPTAIEIFQGPFNGRISCHS